MAPNSPAPNTHLSTQAIARAASWSPGVHGANPNNTDVPLGDQDQGKLIKNFIEHYKKIVYKYEHLTHAVYLICQDGLSELKHDGPSGSSGIKCEFYTRPTNPRSSPFHSAKTPESAERTLVRRRANRERPFESEEEIFQDMYDLSAITIALYHPNDLEQVREFIYQRFDVVATREWPDFQNINPKIGKVPYPQLGIERQFPGYVGVHFIVKLKGRDLITGKNIRCRGSLAEIQVKSLIMWAWQKVHHELIYKPGTGIQADQDDERMMDLSNGVIMAGEIALKQIQININKRRQEPQREFQNSYGMLDYITTKWIENNAKPEWLSKYRLTWLYQHILFTSLGEFKYNTPDRLDKLIEGCEGLLPNDADDEDQHDLLARILYKLAGSPEVQEQIDKVVPSKEDAQNAYSKRLKRVRYRLWLVCHSIKWMYSSYLPPNLTQDIMSEVRERVKTKPDLDGILSLLHPTKPPRTLLKEEHNDVIDEADRFCDEILNNQIHFRFKLAVALAKLTWYITPAGEIHQYEINSNSLEEVRESIFRVHPSSPISPTHADRWLPLANDKGIDVESIASCPLELSRLARYRRPASMTEQAAASPRPISPGSEDEKDAAQRGRGRKRRKLNVTRKSDYYLASPPNIPKRLESGKSNQAKVVRDAVIVPCFHAAEWVIIASECCRDDWVSNCVHAGFDKLKVYLDSSDS